ncbi:MAG: hypothetical protein PGMFKBFP_00699 [Anaerolineales bacterium]|nr:hypothetical protein [Anaerolineales bacterium]
MPDAEDDDGDGQAEEMPGVKASQGGLAGFSSANGEAEEKAADERDRLEQVGPSGEGPADVHVPAQDVAGEVEQNGEDKESQPEQIVEAARGFVRGGEDHAQKVKRRDDDQRLRRPEVQVADESAEGDEIGDGLHRERGFVRAGDIVEHLQDTRHAEDEQEEDGGPARAQSVTPARLRGGDGGRVQVMEEGRAHGCKLQVTGYKLHIVG